MQDYPYIKSSALTQLIGLYVCLQYTYDDAISHAIVDLSVPKAEREKHAYSHAQFLAGGKIVSQNWVFEQYPVVKILTDGKKRRLKLWRNKQWDAAKEREIKAQIETLLKKPWYSPSRLYDLPKLLISALGIHKTNGYGAICSERVAQIIGLPDPCQFTPYSLDAYFSDSPDWEAVCYDPVQTKSA